MWSAVKVAELVYIALYHLVFSVIAGAVPLLGKVILGLFYVVANVLEVLLNVSVNFYLPAHQVSDLSAWGK